VADIREFNKTKHDEPGKMVDFDKAAEELGCSKVELTKNKRPEFLAWAEKQ